MISPDISSVIADVGIVVVALLALSLAYDGAKKLLNLFYLDDSWHQDPDDIIDDDDYYEHQKRA